MKLLLVEVLAVLKQFKEAIDGLINYLELLLGLLLLHLSLSLLHLQCFDCDILVAPWHIYIISFLDHGEKVHYLSI